VLTEFCGGQIEREEKCREPLESLKKESARGSCLLEVRTIYLLRTNNTYILGATVARHELHWRLPSPVRRSSQECMSLLWNSGTSSLRLLCLQIDHFPDMKKSSPWRGLEVGSDSKQLCMGVLESTCSRPEAELVSFWSSARSYGRPRKSLGRLGANAHGTATFLEPLLVVEDDQVHATVGMILGRAHNGPHRNPRVEAVRTDCPHTQSIAPEGYICRGCEIRG
jgi:hypothetical protein